MRRFFHAALIAIGLLSGGAALAPAQAMPQGIATSDSLLQSVQYRPGYAQPRRQYRPRYAPPPRAYSRRHYAPRPRYAPPPRRYYRR